MATEIRMPELAADVTEADLVGWLVKVGDQIEAGDLIAEIETDKSTVEFESPVSGTLKEIRVAEGTTGVKVGTVLAVVEPLAEAADDDAPDEAEARDEANADEDRAETGEPAPDETSEPEPDETSEPEPDGTSEPEPEPAPRAGTAARDEGLASITALARRVADQAGLDVAELEGSGAGGRIVKADVEAALKQETHREPPGAEASRGDSVGVAHSRMRRTIARRMSESKREVPHFYLAVECNVDRVLAIRRDLNARDDGTRLSLNDFVVKAAALALRRVPGANVAWTEDELLHHDRADVSVAVATEGGLVTPVLRDADRKGVATISHEIRDLAERARAGKLTPAEYRDGTFTVSNLGMYGIERVYAIVNPPESCILGVGAAEPRAVVRDGAVGAATCMTCTLSADHRALDGATGAEWLATFKRLLEEPLDMIL